MRNLYFIICSLLISGSLGLLSHYLDIEPFGNKDRNELYSVQLATLKYPVYLSYFKGVDNVVEIVAKDGSYRYCLKPFADKEEVDKLCAQIKKKGYPEAKVIRLGDVFDEAALGEATGNVKGSDNLREKSSDRELAKIRNQQDKNRQKEEAPIVKAMAKMPGVGSEYFYSIQILQSSRKQDAISFKSLGNVREYSSDGGGFRYLHGNFADVEDAEKYLKREIKSKYPEALVVVVDKGLVVAPQVPSIEDQESDLAVGSKKMDVAKRPKGREFVDYFFEESQSKFPVSSAVSGYVIELGPYKDANQARAEIQRLKDLGYQNPKIVSPGDRSKEGQTAQKGSSSMVYTIQIFATSKPKNVGHFKVKGVKQAFSETDGLYRYYVGDYDNYWVCRRQLREIRNSGYKDAFIVKLDRK